MKERVAAASTMELRDGRRVTIRRLSEQDRTNLQLFGMSLPTDDLLYLEDDFQSPEIITRLINAHAAENWRQIVAVLDDGTIAGYSALRRLPGWSSHVGDIRLLVGSEWRRSGLGVGLARAIVESAPDLGLSKLMVDMIAEQSSGRAIFERLGFRIEGTLIDHVRDRQGMPHNLLVMAITMR
ncbi:GNAT family N-acetyltransferase [Candidatus Gracilibacteria bacterium]|nr:GNAT family N-acetyltransferase [Candidatus Gracilibacteria bacterium]